MTPPARADQDENRSTLDGDVRPPLRRARMAPGASGVVVASLVLHVAFLTWLRPGAVEGPTSPGGPAAIQVAFVMPGADAVRSRISAGRPGAVPTAVASGPPDTADPFQAPAEPTPGLPKASDALSAGPAAAGPAVGASAAAAIPRIAAASPVPPPAPNDASVQAVAPPITQLDVPALAAAAPAAPSDIAVAARSPETDAAATSAVVRPLAAARDAETVAPAPAVEGAVTTPAPAQSPLSAAPAGAARRAASAAAAAAEATPTTAPAAAPTAQEVAFVNAAPAAVSSSDAETANAEDTAIAVRARQPGDVKLADAAAAQGGAATTASVAPPADAPPARTLTAAPLERRAATVGASAAARAIVDDADPIIAQATSPRPVEAQTVRPAVAEAPLAGVIRGFQPRTLPPPPLPPRRPPSLRFAERNPRIGAGALAGARGLGPLGPAIPGIDDGLLPLGVEPRPAGGAATAAPAPSSGEAPIRRRSASTAPGGRRVDARPSYRGAGLSNPDPVYPFAAQRRRQEGRVLLRVDVDVDGRAALVLVRRSSGFPILDDAAVRAVSAWRFKPALVAGVAARGSLDVPIDFRLR